MVGKCSWDDIRLRPQHREHSLKGANKACEGFDTETKNGYAKIIASSTAWREVESLDDCLELLTRGNANHEFNMFWNINFDFNVIFKWDRDTLYQIHEKGEARYKHYYISYLKSKSFLIHDLQQKKKYRYYDAFQFYKSKLSKAAEKYLGQSEHELKQDRANLFDNHSIKEIGDYCQDDAMKTKLLSERLVEGFNKQQLYLKHLFSTGYVAQEYVLRKTDVCTMWDVPKPVNRMYWQAYRGGWFDTYKRGVMKVTSYDLSSAYPAVMYNFPDLRQGKWKKGIDEDQAIGVITCKLKSDLMECQPLAVKSGILNVYPLFANESNISMTLQEYKALKKHMDIEVQEAWTFHEQEGCRRPYQEIISYLYDLKQKAEKNSSDYLVSKLIMNSSYGKTCELTKRKDKAGVEKWTIGKLFNPVYAAETTAWARVELFNHILPYSKHVVSVLTDAVMFDREISLPQKTGLGAFELKHKDMECLVVQTGVYQFEDGDGATRGFGKNTDLWKVVDTDSTALKVNVLKPMNFKECIIQDCFEKIGVFVEKEKKIDLNKDRKRLWEDVKSAKQLLNGPIESWPVPVSQLYELSKMRS